MTVLVLVVLARILSNPLSNVFQKQLAQRSADPVFVIAATHALLTVVALPLLVRAPPPGLDATFWTSMAIAAVLAVAGNALLVGALRAGDLSVLGPINAYKAVLSLALAVVLLGEVPTVFGLAGVVLILAGSYVVIDRAPGATRMGAFAQFAREPGVRLRFAALACSATEAVFLKRALLSATPLHAFLLWSVLGLPVAGLAVVLLLRGAAAGQVRRFGGEWRTYLALAVTTGLMQLTTLLTFGTLQVGYSLALFQLSTLVSVYLGHRIFREGSLRRRLVGSAIMVVGAVLIVALGRRG